MASSLFKRLKGFRSRSRTSDNPVNHSRNVETPLATDAAQHEPPATNRASEPTERLGLHRLWPPSEDTARNSTIDIVALHGLGGDAFNTWKLEQTIWLRDLLPESLHDANIMSYGYNSGLAFTGSASGIGDYATGLLEAVTADREHLSTEQNPLIFVCHSLGGIVFKQALILAHEHQKLYGKFLPCVKGVMFFGTPHRGSDIASWTRIFRSIAQLPSLGTLRTDLLKDLETKSNTLGRICGQFVERATPLQIVTIYERKIIPGLTRLIVDADSAKLNLDNERVIPIEATHITMCGFSSSTDPQYKIILQRLLALARAARTETQSPAAQGPINRSLRPQGGPPSSTTSYIRVGDHANLHNGSVYGDVIHNNR